MPECQRWIDLEIARAGCRIFEIAGVVSLANQVLLTTERIRTFKTMPAQFAAESLPPMNHIFVDFENVHHVDFDVLGSKMTTITMLMGARQTKLDTDLVEKLMENVATVKLVRMTSVGKNAVDFALSYYLGKAVLEDPTAYFHIISKDTGFDPLVEHLRSRHVHVRRHEGFENLSYSAPLKKVAAVVPVPVPPAKKAPARAASKPVVQVAGPDDPLARMLDHLRKHPNNRPKRQKTLLSHLQGFLGKNATKTAVENLMEQLLSGGFVRIGEKERVEYHLAG